MAETMALAAQREKELRDLACDGHSGDAQLERMVFSALMECFGLWKERHLKYGRGNIAAFGALGCLVRGSDKIARLREAYLNGNGTRAADESIEDSWRDMVNYGAMGLLCERGEWPGAPKS